MAERPALPLPPDRIAQRYSREKELHQATMVTRV